jgi:protein SCO1/2
MSNQRNLYMLAGSILAVAALFAGLYLGGAFRKPLSDLTTATLYPADFRELEDFALSDQQGQTYTLDNLRGQWSLIFFGYSYCPDICPMTLYLLNQVDALVNAGNPANPVEIVFVSVDPERDTSDRLKEYVEYFNPRFTGLTGARQQIDRLVNSLGVYYRKQESSDGKTYLVDHSAGLFLINPAGKPQALFSAPHMAENLARDILLITEYYGHDNA